jgi:hypothetical protein
VNVIAYFIKTEFIRRKKMRKLVILLSALGLVFSMTFPSYAESKSQLKKRPPEKTDIAQKVLRRPPDLTIRIDATDTVRGGASIPHCKVVVKNIGKSIARGTSTAGNRGYMVDVVLSSDTHVPVGLAGYSPNFSDDVLLKGGRISNTPDLLPDQSRTFFLNNVLIIPYDTKSGKYSLGGIVDSGKKITENRENNNTTCRKLRVEGNSTTYR